MKLDEVSVNKAVKVIEVNCNKCLKQRLYDLGLVPGAIITPVFSSPFNNPRAYEFIGNIIAIRNNDAHQIIVSLL